jgi:membrane-associated phospholipid phosphatase
MVLKLNILLISLLAISFSFAQNLDIDILRDINLNRNKNLDETFHIITNSAAPLSIAIPICIFVMGIIKKDSAIKRNSLKIGSTYIGASLIATVVKYSVNRPRPFITYSYLEAIGEGGSPSFPSGHTCDAFATATAISLAYPKWYIIVPAYLWASAVGYSRIHLGVHYPSDILGGVIIGAGSAFLFHKVNKYLINSTENKLNKLYS